MRNTAVRLSTSTAQIRLLAINDVYEVANLPKLQTLLSKLRPKPLAIILAGDFLSPSPLSSLDGGRGMVQSLRMVGITHASLGNHEADLSLKKLEKKLRELSKSVTIVNSNLTPSNDDSWLSEVSCPYDFISSPCKSVNIALMGLMSDEDGVFRNGTFKGIPIGNVLQTYSQVHAVTAPNVDLVVPITHQSIHRDRELAAHILKTTGNSNGLIIGGHEHEPILETVVGDYSNVMIAKAGYDARAASLIDLHFDISSSTPILTHIDYDILDVMAFEDSYIVKKIVDLHTKVLKDFEHQVILDASTHILPPGASLTSKRTRYTQTTIGAFFCQALKEELEADVALLNGATIKGGSDYGENKMTYAELRKELPFPTKMVVVAMTRAELEEAVQYSKTHSDEGVLLSDESDHVPRRGYLQVDWDYEMSHAFGNLDETVQVALPRNLLNGFCNILPLMRVGDRLRGEGKFPGPDDFIPAMELIVRYCSKHAWSDLLYSLQDSITFEKLDLNKDGVLDRDEIKAMMKNYYSAGKKEPPDFVIDDMLKAIDVDHDGLIDVGEFSHLMAIAERDHRW